ncbi:MAG TPA: four helix bundle protein [Bacteroidales bacterium]|nr:four helix bundle protein [Bacteroidales bacterium]
MNNKDFAMQMEKRTKSFAIKIISLSATLPNTIEGKIIRNQLTKSGTSIGANYREANRARSKADFKNKIKICESESNESSYWLEILQDMKWSASGQELAESNELLAIFSSIGKSLT